MSHFSPTLNMNNSPTKLWYQTLSVLYEDAPELVDEFLENTAAKMEVTVDYLYEEFLPND